VWLSSPAGERLGECWFGPLFGSDTDWYVYDVVLAEEHRGHGLGREAMEAVAAACRRAGAGRLGLTVERHNTPAIAAYRAAGFATTREDATSADMWRTLAPPPTPQRGS
jgi:ribosomal protein S18 acetylase RimI-like enzyme